MPNPFVVGIDNRGCLRGNRFDVLSQETNIPCFGFCEARD
jgi:hypothetical protein